MRGVGQTLLAGLLRAALGGILVLVIDSGVIKRPAAVLPAPESERRCSVTAVEVGG